MEKTDCGSDVLFNQEQAPIKVSERSLLESRLLVKSFRLRAALVVSVKCSDQIFTTTLFIRADESYVMDTVL